MVFNSRKNTIWTEPQKFCNLCATLCVAAKCWSAADLRESLWTDNEIEVMEFIALFVQQTDLFLQQAFSHSVSHVSRTTAQKSCCDTTRLIQARVAIVLLSQARKWLLDKWRSISLTKHLLLSLSSYKPISTSHVSLVCHVVCHHHAGEPVLLYV